MKHIALFATLTLFACDGGGEEGPPLITSYSVSCGADDKVTFSASVDGTPADGLVYMQETASEYLDGGSLVQFSDEHDLKNNAAGDGLTATIATGVTLGSDERNVSTIFSCGGHFEENASDGSPFMTYAFGVYGPAGDIVDCLAGGNDPEGLIAGDYEAAAVNPPSGEFDLSACVAEQ